MRVFLLDNAPRRSVIQKQGYPATLQDPHEIDRSYNASLAGLWIEEDRASPKGNSKVNFSPSPNAWTPAVAEIGCNDQLVIETVD